jgi:hypothetical protein
MRPLHMYAIATYVRTYIHTYRTSLAAAKRAPVGFSFGNGPQLFSLKPALELTLKLTLKHPRQNSCSIQRKDCEMGKKESPTSPAPKKTSKEKPSSHCHEHRHVGDAHIMSRLSLSAPSSQTLDSMGSSDNDNKNTDSASCTTRGLVSETSRNHCS